MEREMEREMRREVKKEMKYLCVCERVRENRERERETYSGVEVERGDKRPNRLTTVGQLV